MICDIKLLFDFDITVTLVHVIHHSCQLGDIIAACSYVALTTANCCVTAIYFIWCNADKIVIIVCPVTRNKWHCVCSCLLIWQNILSKWNAEIFAPLSVQWYMDCFQTFVCFKCKVVLTICLSCWYRICLLFEMIWMLEMIQALECNVIFNMNTN